MKNYIQTTSKVSGAVLFTLFCLTLFANSPIAKKIKFNSNESIISENEINELQSLLQSLKSTEKKYSVNIFGHTDSDGSKEYNEVLSRKRAETVKRFFVQNGIQENAINTKYFGESKPEILANSRTAKEQNRRVEIVVEYLEKTNLTTIKNLYELLAPKTQQFSINSCTDTTITCSNGTVVKLPANIFDVPANDCSTIDFNVTEVFNKSTALFTNLSTRTTEGENLKSAGMFKFSASVNGTSVDLKPNAAFEVEASNVNSTAGSFQLFNGQHNDDNVMNWDAIAESNFTTTGDANCTYRYPDMEYTKYSPNRCKFFVCRAKRLDNVMKGVVDKKTRIYNRAFRFTQRKLKKQLKNVSANNSNIGISFSNINYEQVYWEDFTSRKFYLKTCNPLLDTLRRYGVNSYDEYLVLKMEKLLRKYDAESFESAVAKVKAEQYQKYEVSNFQDYLAAKNEEILEANIESGNVQTANRFLFSSAKLGWVNIDQYLKQPNKWKRMASNMQVAPTITCQLVFKNQFSIYPPYTGNGQYEFFEVPNGEEVAMVSMKYENGKAYISINEFKAGVEEVPAIKFEEVTIDELKERLKVLDKKEVV